MKDPACTQIPEFSDCVGREIHPLCLPQKASNSAPGFEDPNPGLAAYGHPVVVADLDRRGLNTAVKLTARNSPRAPSERPRDTSRPAVPCPRRPAARMTPL